MYLDFFSFFFFFFFYFIFLTFSSLGFSSLALENDSNGISISVGLNILITWLTRRNLLLNVLLCFWMYVHQFYLQLAYYKISSIMQGGHWCSFLLIKMWASMNLCPLYVIEFWTLTLDPWIFIIKVIFKWTLFINSFYLR